MSEGHKKLYSDVLRTGLTLNTQCSNHSECTWIKISKKSNRYIRKGTSHNFKRSVLLSNKFSPLDQPEVTKQIKLDNCGKKSGNKCLNLALWNAQSLRKKTQTVKEFRDESDIDIFLFVETWLKDDDMFEIGELERNGECFFIHEPRKGRQGGGVGCLVKSGLNVRKNDSLESKTFEHMEIQLDINNKTVTILLVYRPEPSGPNQYQMSEFYEEFNQLLAHYHTYKNEVIIAGDFNFHMNKPNDKKVFQFNNLLEMFDLKQHISSPTHTGGNTLDLVITRKNSLLFDCTVGELNSDHNCITMKLGIKKHKNITKEVTVRKTRSINLKNFKKDLGIHLSNNMKRNTDTRNFHDSHYLDKLVDLYNSTECVLDKHAPAKVKNIVIRNPTPWTNANIKGHKIQCPKKVKGQFTIFQIIEHHTSLNDVTALKLIT